MTETTDPITSSATLQTCVVCGVKLIGGVAVALIEQGSGPGRVLYACRGCVKFRNLLPLDEQADPVGDGRLRFREQTTPSEPGHQCYAAE